MNYPFKNLVFDGGVLNNYPVKLFDREKYLDYTLHLIETIPDAQNNQHLHSDDWHRTIYIDTLGVKTTEFDLSDGRKNDSIKSGSDATTQYLKWWNDTSKDLAVNHPSSTK